MLPPFRLLALAALGMLAPAAYVQAADDALPPEPITGEWIEDTLVDDSLWFAASGNLGFEAVAAELKDYPPGRRWVHVVDGRPAWVIYYVPGEILGFEIDTHHLGARATDFRFAAGTTWNNLHPVEADYEEIAGFDAQWMRLYRTANVLPARTRFLRIEFPDDAERDSARLTEVWLRCRFESVAAPAPAGSPADSDQAPLPPAVVEDFVVEPFIVTGVRFAPPISPGLTPLRLSPSFGAALALEAPRTATKFDLAVELPPLPEPPSNPIPPRTLFGTIADFFRRGF